MAKILIKNGRVWDGERFLYADVLTDADKIVQIEPSISEDADFVYDATGKTVSPGLVDLHVHMQGPEPDRFGISADLSSVPFGVTAVADAGGAHADKVLVRNHLVKSVTFVTATIRDNRADFSTTEKKLALYEDSAIGIKAYFDASKGQVWDITPLEEICRYARDRKYPVMVHCSGTPVPMAQILEALSPGDVLTHVFHGGSHTAAEDSYESLKKAKKRGVVLDAGFAGHVHTDFGVLKGAVENGILPDTISTDITRASAYKRGGRYGMTTCMSMARTVGMAEEEIFRAVTSAPARVLGKEKEWGSLEVGRIADLAVFDFTNEGFDLTDRAGNRLTSSTGYRCKLTVADGEIVWRD